MFLGCSVNFVFSGIVQLGSCYELRYYYIHGIPKYPYPGEYFIYRRILYICMYIYIYTFVSSFEIINIPCTQSDRIDIYIYIYTYIYICKTIWWEFIEHIFNMLSKTINNISWNICNLFGYHSITYFILENSLYQNTFISTYIYIEEINE